MWFVLLMILLAAVLAYRVLTVEPRNRVTLKALSESKNQAQTKEIVVKEAQEESVSDESLPQYTMSEVDTILAVLQPHLFHPDPYLETSMMFELKPHCGFKRSKIKHQCDEVMSRFNQLKGLLHGFQDLKAIPSNSELGKAFKNRRAYDPKQPDLFRHQEKQILKLLLNSENTYLLTFKGVIYQYYGVDYGEILPFSRWLNSQDQEYNRMVLMYGLLKMANRYQVDDSDRLVVEMICHSHKPTCGLGFDEAYEKIVMPGMRKDVDIMVSHLDDFAATN